MNSGFKLMQLTFVADMHGTVNYQWLSQLVHLPRPDELSIKLVSNEGILIFFNTRLSARLLIILGRAGSSRAIVMAKSELDAKALSRQVCALLLSFYSICSNPTLKRVSAMYQYKLHNFDPDRPLVLNDFTCISRYSRYEIFRKKRRTFLRRKKSNCSCTASVASNGNVLLWGASKQADAYSVARLVETLQGASNYREDYEAVFADVDFEFISKKIPVLALVPTQENLLRQKVEHYIELMKKGSRFTIIAIRARVHDEEKYILLDGHHRTRAVYEIGKHFIDVVVISPSMLFESKAPIIIENNMPTIADLRYA